MLPPKAIALAAIAARLASGAIIYEQAPTSYQYVTATPTDEEITVTASNFAIRTIESTLELTTTIYRAPIKPVTLYTGTIWTVLSTVEPNRVQVGANLPTTAVQQTLIPTSYTAPVQITPVPSAAPVLPPTPGPGLSTPGSSTMQTVISSSTQSAPTASGNSNVPVAVPSSQAPSSVPSSSAAPSSAAPSSSAAPNPPADPNDPQGQSFSYSEGTNLFNIISGDSPPSAFPREDLKIQLPPGVPLDSPVHTNKFYTNMILSDQTSPVYVQPYTAWWSKLDKFPGFAISHTTFAQRVFGPDASANPAEYFINPTGLISLGFSAGEFTKDNMALTLSNMDTFSALATLSGGAGGGGKIEFPMVQGMGFVTAKYDGTLTPRIFTQLGLDTFVHSLSSPSPNIQKYVAKLFNGVSWLVYVTVPEGTNGFSLSVDSSGNIVGSAQCAVTIQVAVVPDGTEAAYDQAAGMYPVGASLSGSVGGGTTASYSIAFKTEGSSVGGTTVMMALPHHVQSFTGNVASKATTISLDSTTKGEMKGYLTNSFDFNESLNPDIQFLPWSATSAFNANLSYSAEALQKIAAAANSEIAFDLSQATNLDSTYFSGKVMDKYAYILLVLSNVLDNSAVTGETLKRLQDAFATFTSNKQQTPLMYDTLLKGITSSAGQNGDPGTDFGSPYYNDHQFHYGYFIHAAAVIAFVDKQAGGTWGADNKAWVNSLVRDVANPSHSDPYFPVFRSFDWFNGHSWAKGMFASSDGKDLESSSEDYNFAYGMKLWGSVIGDPSMEARGDLMLSVMRRTMDNYFYMTSSNTNQPANFIKNKVPGITFENKLHHVTYFGTNPEYIQGIHMIPVTPVSSYLRQPQFVEEEWTSVISGLVQTVNSGWLGILRLNQALYDPVSSYNFFAQPNFQQQWLDNGASLTWCLAFSAGVGGSQS